MLTKPNRRKPRSSRCSAPQRPIASSSTWTSGKPQSGTTPNIDRRQADLGHNLGDLPVLDAGNDAVALPPLEPPADHLLRLRGSW
jgi:hypothetical protein